jgi:uncharacterized heparinase superfamily protein
LSFLHLNEEHSIQPGKVWRVKQASDLWNYHLHYFDDLVSDGFKQRRKWHQDLVQNWINSNPVGSSPGWDAYPTSKRVVNWIKAEMTEPVLDQADLDSLAVQIRSLVQKPEYHLLGNHLWANSKAMIFAGLFFGGHLRQGESGRWLNKGIRIAERQLKEQVRSDGSHFEQSPMYHALMLEDVLDIINLGRALGWDGFERWTKVAGKMLGFFEAVCHPDGQLALFNDSATNIAPEPESLLLYARRLGVKPEVLAQESFYCRHFPESGLVRVDKEDWSLFFDSGVIGPDYIPGHAHADNLTFELSFQGRRLIVDSGTGLYGTGMLRHYQRSTAAHNTIRVDRRDSSEVWSGFRVARRAKPLWPAKIYNSEKLVTCQASHSGYTRLSGGVVHERKISINSGEITIQDNLCGKYEHELEMFLHFHPDYQLNKNGESWQVIESKSGEIKCRVALRGFEASEKEKYFYSPEFGSFIQAERLVARKKSFLPCTLQTGIIVH